MEDPVDRTLVERAQRGDRAAFRELAPPLSDRLYPVALRIVRDADLAGEILQRALVQIWRDLPSLRDPERLEWSSYRVVVRLCRQHLRRVRPLSATVTLIPRDLIVRDAQLEVSARDELERAFARLTLEQRAVVALLYVRHMTIADIAAALGIPAGTVTSRLHAARRVLRVAVEADARLTVGEGGPA